MRPPAGFVAVELGFGLLEGPSIITTMQDLEKTNRRNRAQLAEAERPKRPRMTGARAQRAVRALVAGARSSAA